MVRKAPYLAEVPERDNGNGMSRPPTEIHVIVRTQGLDAKRCNAYAFHAVIDRVTGS